MTNIDDDSAVRPYIAGTWYIDPTHSQVTCTLRHTMVMIRCSFLEFHGRIVTGETVEESSVEATINPASFTTGLSIRDEKVRSLPPFLWSEMYPSIDFRSTSVIPGADGEHYQLVGELSLHGVTREVVLDLTTSGIGRIDHYGTRAGFTATTQFDRRDFGMKGPSMPLRTSRPLSDENEQLGWTINVHLEIEAVLESDAGDYGIDPVMSAE